jgi:Outer membrane cobalamin receptor protein
VEQVKEPVSVDVKVTLCKP